MPGAVHQHGALERACGAVGHLADEHANGIEEVEPAADGAVVGRVEIDHARLGVAEFLRRQRAPAIEQKNLALTDGHAVDRQIVGLCGNPFEVFRDIQGGDLKLKRMAEAFEGGQRPSAHLKGCPKVGQRGELPKAVIKDNCGDHGAGLYPAFACGIQVVFAWAPSPGLQSGEASAPPKPRVLTYEPTPD